MSTIIVFTDDKNWRMDSIDEEGNEGFQVKSYCCPVEFINELLNYRVDSVLLDLDSTGEKTEKMISIIRNIQPKLRIGLMTNKRDNPHLLSALSMGVFSYYLKPVSSNRLQTLLSSAVKGK